MKRKKRKVNRKAKKKGSKILNYLVLILIFFLALNFIESVLEEPGIEYYKEKFVSVGNSTLVRMDLPAVDSEGKGISTLLSIEAMKGKGRTLVDIDNLLFWADTQHSIRMARLVADDFTEKNVDDYDLIYNIEANATLIGGPSAGAAITIATVFVLRAESFRENVMITGTINHDGSIGPVTGILEKAKASKEKGASIFLVPLLQSRDVIYETRKHCEEFGNMEVCSTETIPKKVDVSEEAGIEVIEVADIEEALRYFEVS